jgi:hypothetical protein
VRYHLIYQTVLFRLFRTHDPVTLDIVFDHFKSLPAMLSQYLAGQLAHPHNLFSVYSDVGRLAGYPPYRGLVNKNAGIRKR